MKLPWSRKPKAWPPQAGDIWKAGGREYHAQSGPAGILLRPVLTAESFKALNPELVSRGSKW